MRRAPGGAGLRGRGPGFQVEITHASGASAGPGRAARGGGGGGQLPGPFCAQAGGAMATVSRLRARTPRAVRSGPAQQPLPRGRRSRRGREGGSRGGKARGRRLRGAGGGRRAGRGGGGGGSRVARSSRRGSPGGGGTQPDLGGTGFRRGPGPATRRRRRRSPFGPREMRVSVAAPAPRGGGAGPARSRGVAVAGAAAAEPRHPARPEPPGRGWRNGGGAGGLVGGGRQGPALSHRGRLGPGRAAAPGAGRPGLDYALGKSPIHRRRRRPCGAGLFLSRDRAGAAALGPGHFGRARLASCGDPHGAPGLVPLPLGVAPPRSGPDSCSPVG